MSLSIASRYAQALFEIAKDDKGLKALEADADALGAALAASPELAEMIASPGFDGRRPCGTSLPREARKPSLGNANRSALPSRRGCDGP